MARDKNLKTVKVDSKSKKQEKILKKLEEKQNKKRKCKV